MTDVLDELMKFRPFDPERVAEAQSRMIEEVRAYRLRELREAQDLTQVQLAELLDISQNRVSRIERGDIEHSRVDTVRRYVEAVGGRLRLEVELDEARIRIA
jgi:predicted transcriptional regulator